MAYLDDDTMIRISKKIIKYVKSENFLTLLVIEKKRSIRISYCFLLYSCHLDFQATNG